MQTHVWDITVAWAHCDAQRIVFYPHFYVWFDEATERLFRANGLTYPILAERYGIVGMPLVETGATYKAPCRLGEAVRLESRVSEWRGRSFLVGHRIVHADGTLAVEGFERRVWALADASAPKGMRAGPVPEEVIALFAD